MLKGGVLVADIVGLDYRSTMDIDATLQYYPLSEEMLTQAINEITRIDENDDTVFRLVRIESIRQEDEYGGLRISMQAQSGNIVVPFSMTYALRCNLEKKNVTIALLHLLKYRPSKFHFRIF